MDSRKVVFRETGVILLGEIVCLALMFAVYALLGRLDGRVMLGGAAGALLAVLNFMVMAMNATVAADRAVRQDVKGGASLMRFSYIARLVVIFVILLALARSGLCDPLASVLPLVFVRAIITIAEFFRRKGGA